MDLSIIFINFNSSNYLVRAINSLKNRTNGIEYEIIVVDNASDEINRRLLNGIVNKYKIILNKTNQGFSVACNQGYEISKGDIILFLNPDVIIADGNFKDVVKFFRNCTKAGAVGVKMLTPDHEPYPSCGIFPSLIKSTYGAILKGVSFMPGLDFSSSPYVTSKWIPSTIEEVNWVEGSCLFVSRKAMPGFDEHYFLFWEEIDLCFKLNQDGWKVIYNPLMSVIHFGNVSADPAKTENFIIAYKSMFYFYRKNRGLLSVLVYRFFRGLAFLWLAYKPGNKTDKKETAKIRGYKSVCKLAFLGK